MNRTQISFLGMGVMGQYMAANLAKSGQYSEVKVWNRTADAPGVKIATDAGCKAYGTIKESVADCPIICICVSDGDAVKSVIQECLPLPKGTLVIDFSTIGPKPTLEIGEILSPLDIAFIDAPVSGGDVGAEKGTLTIMAGGSEADMATAHTAFEIMGKTIIHCGPLGSGQKVKMINQVLCSVHMVALCEAMLLAEKNGLDPQLVVDVCSTGAAGSWALKNLGPQIKNRDFSPGFMVKHILKDIGICQSARQGAHMPGLDLAESYFKEVAQTDGGGEKGTQAMFLTYLNK